MALKDVYAKPLASLDDLGGQLAFHLGVLKAVQKASAGNTVPEVRQIFDKAAEIDNISSISGRDLDISKEGDKVVVKFAYNKEIHMFGPAWLLLKYSGTSRPGR